MIINPLNVVRLLLISISSIYLTETPVTEPEIVLKENIQKLLLDSIFHNGLEVSEETYLDYQEPYNSEIIEDEEAWSEDNLNFHPQCSNNDADFDSSYKRRAVEYWRNWDINEKNKNKRNRPLKSVQNKFRRISSERQLRRWKEQLHSGGNHIEKLSYISKFTHNKFTAAVDQQFGSENVFNSDLSGFQLEIHSGRSLSNEGVKKVECVAQSISSTTHSYNEREEMEGMEGMMTGVMKVGESRVRVLGVYINMDLQSKLEGMVEWMEGREEGVKTVIGGDFNVRTGREGGENNGGDRRRGGRGEKIKG
ncbi:hypothetical protein ALC57_14516 [Trachymyrmex cornetzi]|uniref:Endonuclease/exonuclease/phosphatase domain-containing protein n=1 Tax=Trachymyrmex cornetzi TaxID=471704 RepID=A0A151IYI0_9HYME|nr:hypothetical protein ALC57_14516 [Trachymyrmex cornetzi]